MSSHRSHRSPRSARPLRRSSAVAAVAVLALVLAGCGSSSSDSSATTTGEVSTTSASTTSTEASGDVTTLATTDLEVDESHDYGNKYADGILPVGDGKFTLDAPEKGSIYLCREMGDGGGAQERGPWFTNDDTEYDLSKKVHVEGSVEWNGDYSATVDGDTRTIHTNDVPDDHTTGEFPVAEDDPAHQYDSNPNHIEEQDYTYELPAEPTLLDEPACMGGESGVMNTGVALFNGFDAGNRDAGAWEVQDDCDGHPQTTSEYHYHTLSTCIDDVGVGTVIGWALDGFPITGPTVSDGNVLTTDDLDECHGITGVVTIDGKQVKTYHYVMTQDFPYSVSCFRGTATKPPGIPG